jgi:diguanylate cyclase (GGDEF)-like protein
MDIYQALLDDESVRGERVAWLFRWVFYGIVACLAAVKYFIIGDLAGLFGLSIAAFAVVYNLSLWPMIKRRQTKTWIRYLSVTIDVIGLTLYNLVDAIYTSPFVPVTTATLLLYPSVIFLASLRLDRRLIVYATVLSVVTTDALFAWAYPGFEPAVVDRLVSATIPGQIYRTAYLSLAGFLMLFVPGTITRLLKTQRDVYEDYQETARLSVSDNLTGLSNRRGLEPWFEKWTGIAARSGAKLAVMYIDLDRFKPINDTWGHEAGDSVLKAVAIRLRDAVRDGDLVARVGGDEFIVALSIPDNAEGIAVIVDRLSGRIAESVAQPIELDHGLVSVGASVGVAIYPEDGKTMKELVELADGRMLKRKRDAR